MPGYPPVCDLLPALKTLLPAGVDGTCKRLADNPAHRRERDFLAGRAIAAELFDRHGIGNLHLPRASNGAPCWPSGWTGSISHCDVWAVAVIAPPPASIALGIDVERIADWSESLQRIVCSATEIAAVAELPRPQQNPRFTALFSAKECLFKALNPIAGQWLDFTDAVCLTSCDACFTFWLPRYRQRCMVRWRQVGDHVLSLAALPAPVLLCRTRMCGIENRR
jgi:4'-phosphopantetheinyl transferase EntD